MNWRPVAERLLRDDFRFVIVPSGEAGAEIVGLLKGVELYRDVNFVVYRCGTAQAGMPILLRR